METSTVSGVGPVLTTQKPSSRGFQDLSGEDFLLLLIQELQMQDPMNPTDNKEIVAQMAGVRQMEQSAKLNKTLEALAAEQRFGSTSGLIGHYVAGRVTDNSGRSYEIQGLVIGVRYEQGNAILELHNGKQLPATKVEQVTLVDNLPPEIREQLRRELGGTVPGETDGTAGSEDDEGENGGENEGDDGDSAARAIRADAAAKGTRLTAGSYASAKVSSRSVMPIAESSPLRPLNNWWNDLLGAMP